jgi:hypothetical protein
MKEETPMKKWIAFSLTLSLMLGTAAFPAFAQQSAGLKFGLYINTTLVNSMDAADTDGLAQVDSTAVAVLVDADGRLVDLAIDDAQTKMPFTAQGILGADFPAQPETKTEMGTQYGMSTVSAVGEWDQQMEALRVYLIGKTAQEVQGIAVDDSTHPTGADLTAGCTMAIGDYITGVVAAIGKAQPCDAAATDTVGIGIVTTTDRSVDAQDGSDGMCEAYSYYAAVAVSATGAVTACLIDSTQGDVTFDATGKITSDLTSRVSTKQEIGDNYGMKAASSIGKEWYEQANAFAAYVIGKTAAEIDGIALDTDLKPTGADLTASVTIPAGSFKSGVLKAVSLAK